MIGVNSYRDANIPRLSCTLPDAQAVYGFFRSAGSNLARSANVRLFTDEANEDGLVADRQGILLAVTGVTSRSSPRLTRNR